MGDHNWEKGISAMAKLRSGGALASDLLALTGAMRDVLTLVGAQSTLKIISAFGGRRIWIPKRRLGTPLIMQAVGADLTRDLIKLLPGTTLYVPKGESLRAWAAAKERNVKILAMRAAGRPVVAIAGEFGITSRMVYLILTRSAGS